MKAARREGARFIVRSPASLKRSSAGFRRNRVDGEVESEISWLWGVHASLAALANPRRKILKILASRNGAARLPAGLPPGVEVQILDPSAMDGMLPPGAVHQGVAVRAEPLEPMELSHACAKPDGRPVLMLDQVTDPQNVGAAFRCAAAFNARAVILQDRKSPPLTGALAKAAAGAVDIVPHVRATNLSRALDDLAAMGYLTIGLAGEATLSLKQAMADSRPKAIVLGAEGKGLRELVGKTCHRLARIPISAEMESLNVSVAAAIALYEAASSQEQP